MDGFSIAVSMTKLVFAGGFLYEYAKKVRKIRNLKEWMKVKIYDIPTAKWTVHSQKLKLE
jgi:hypothetical protein